MIPGTILLDQNFVFHDGQLGSKYFVVLNRGDDGIYLAVKATSQGRLFENIHGCQVTDRFPNFLLTLGCCWFKKTTYLQLDEFYEFKKNELLQKVMSNQITRSGVILNELVIDILICASHAEDLTKSQEDIVQASLKQVQIQNEAKV